MGVDHTGGTDTRTETTDKPGPSEQQNSLPADKPGSPGQPSRAESLARAREPAQQNGAQQNEVKESVGQPADQRDGETTESSQNGNDSQETGPPGQNEAESTGQGTDERDKGKGASETGEAGSQGRRDEDPRSESKGTTAEDKPEIGGSDDRGQPVGQSPEQRTDSRAETADRPDSARRQYTLPADNPGSPNQPSRIESLARAREPAQWNGTQQSETSSTTDRPTQERDVQPATAQTTSDGPANGVNGRPETVQEQDAGRTVTSQGTPESGDPGRPTDGTSQGQTDVHGETAENRTPSERQYTLPADNPGSPDQPSRLESLARAREPFQQESDTRQAQSTGQEQQDAGGPVADQNPPESPVSEAPRTAEQDPQAPGKPDAEGPQLYHERTGENTEQPFGSKEGGQEVTPGEPQAHERAAKPAGDSEQTPQIPDGERTTDGRTSQPQETERPPEQLGEQRTTDNAARPQEAADREQETSERQGEQDAERGSNTESIETAEATTPNFNSLTHFGPYNPNGNRLLTLEEARGINNGSNRPRETDEPNSEVPRWQSEPLTPHNGPTRDDIGTRGRGEVGSPETDPADENPSEPERPSRRRELLKEGMRKSDDIVNVGKKAVGPAIDALNAKPPTGHPSTVRDTDITMGPSPQAPVKVGSAAIGILGAAILAGRATHWTTQKINERRGRDSASN